MIELRMTMLFTVREIDVECAWAQWDAMRSDIPVLRREIDG